MMPNDPHNNGTMLTVKEAAAFIHPLVSPNTIRDAIHNRGLKAVKLGRRYFINTNEITRFLECQENANQPDYTSAKTIEHGSSLMEGNITGQDMAMAAANMLNKH